MSAARVCAAWRDSMRSGGTSGGAEVGGSAVGGGPIWRRSAACLSDARSTALICRQHPRERSSGWTRRWRRAATEDRRAEGVHLGTWGMLFGVRRPRRAIEYYEKRPVLRGNRDRRGEGMRWGTSARLFESGRAAARDEYYEKLWQLIARLATGGRRETLGNLGNAYLSSRRRGAH